ncbi:MAG: spermidine synthase [Candidatus Contendobacter sp.]|nr:MAG: spermidine synthase [Candidatus Contendobacter sp.]
MTSRPTSPALRIALYSLFVLSGFSGLIYESIWSHYLKLMLGHAAYAQTLVLAIFMGGMALGAWLASRYSRRWSNLLLGYAVAEGLIGLLGLTFHPLFATVLDALYLSWIPALSDPATINALKWTLAALLILPQSVLLGATFPLMSAGIIRLYPDTPGATLGMLYFTNSLGAAAGVLVSVFVLIPAVGLPGTIMTAGILNVLLAIVMWGIAKERRAPAPAESASESGQPASSRLTAALLTLALGSSLASFFYEIGWIRMLSLVLGSSTQAFELMLSAFILGLALGGLWIRRRLDRIAVPLRYAGYVQVLMGLCAVGTLPLYNASFDFMAFMLGGLSKTDSGYTLFNLTSQTIAMAIMIPATLLAGMTLPLFTYALLQRGAGERSIGRVYSANTVGAIIGVLLAVHVVMPAIGVKGLVSLGALLDVVVGLALLVLARPRSRRWELPASAGVAALAFAVVLLAVRFDPLRMAGGVYRHGRTQLPPDTEVQYYRDGKTASIARYLFKDGQMVIATNGKPDASAQTRTATGTLDEITMVMAAVLPLSLRPDARTVANIGFGSGMTTHNLLGADRIERVDTVEIEPAMVEGARGFGRFAERAFTDPRSRIHIEDAKTYFSSHNARYDLIISEPSNPWVSGVASLFSEEFYRYIKNHLNERGLLVQWLQFYESNPMLASSVFKALAQHFSDYVVFNTDSLDILIVASNGGPLNPLDPWILAEPKLQEALNRVGIRSLQDIQVRRLGSKALLQPLFAAFNAPANSDFFPYLSLNAPRSRYLQETAVILSELHLAPIPVLEMLDGQRRAGETPATRAPLFSAPDSQQRAARIAETLLTQQPITPAQLGPSGFDLQLLLRELAVSAPQQPADDIVRALLLKTAELINPYLPASRATPLWDYLASQPGYNALSEATRDWFTLHRAVGRRDTPAMAALTQRLIETTPKDKLSPHEATYLLTAGLTAGLAMGDKAKADALLELFDAHQKPIDEEFPLHLQLLLRQLATRS